MTHSEIPNHRAKFPINQILRDAIHKKKKTIKIGFETK